MTIKADLNHKQFNKVATTNSKTWKYKLIMLNQVQKNEKSET